MRDPHPSGDVTAPNGENPISRFLNGDYRAEPELEILYLNGEFQLIQRLETGTGVAALRLGQTAGRLPRFLRNKLKHIRNAIARGGNSGISGIVSSTDALKLGINFVGKGFHIMSNGKVLISKDGLRQFRLPSAKRGVDPMTGNPFSRTGFQANFESRSIPEGYWTSNVHVDVGL